MKKLFIFLIVIFIPVQVFGEGRTYTGSGQGHCTEWSNKLLKWPQTSVGRETSNVEQEQRNIAMGQLHVG